MVFDILVGFAIMALAITVFTTAIALSKQDGIHDFEEDN